MAKFNRKTAKLCVVAMLSLVIGITAIIYYNNRIVIIRQEVNITDLPKSFEGFTILQISDLHGKRFGRHQERLAAAVNNSRYDMIAVTGDTMFGESYDPQPFYELLSGIKNKQWLFYAQGNTDEIAYDNRSLKTMSYGEELIKRGCKLVNRAYEIKRGQDTLWISPLDSSHFVDIKLKRLEQKMSNTSPSSGSRQAMIEERNYLTAFKEFSERVDSRDTIIALEHYPQSLNYYELETQTGGLEYDLVVAGHYHGGQMRVPLYGAIYVPGSTLPRNGMFPPQSLVSGLQAFGTYQQYVSRGLGSSGSIRWLAFRLFNPPEINLITLVSKPIEDKRSENSRQAK